MTLNYIAIRLNVSKALQRCVYKLPGLRPFQDLPTSAAGLQPGTSLRTPDGLRTGKAIDDLCHFTLSNTF